MNKKYFLRPWWILAGSIPARRICSYIQEAVARFCVRYMDIKKAVAPKNGTTAAGTTKTATKERKVYRRILMRSAPVSGKK